MHTRTMRALCARLSSPADFIESTCEHRPRHRPCRRRRPPPRCPPPPRKKTEARKQGQRLPVLSRGSGCDGHAGPLASCIFSLPRLLFSRRCHLRPPPPHPPRVPARAPAFPTVSSHLLGLLLVPFFLPRCFPFHVLLILTPFSSPPSAGAAPPSSTALACSSVFSLTVTPPLLRTLPHAAIYSTR